MTLFFTADFHASTILQNHFWRSILIFIELFFSKILHEPRPRTIWSKNISISENWQSFDTLSSLLRLLKDSHGVWYDVKEWVTCVVYWVNQKYKDCNWIDTSSCITIYVSADGCIFYSSPSPYLSELEFSNPPVWNIEFDEMDFFPSLKPTGYFFQFKLDFFQVSGLAGPCLTIYSLSTI